MEVSSALRAATRGRADNPHGRRLVVARYRHPARKLHDWTAVLGRYGCNLRGRWRFAGLRRDSLEPASLRADGAARRSSIRGKLCHGLYRFEVLDFEQRHNEGGWRVCKVGKRAWTRGLCSPWIVRRGLWIGPSG